MLFLRREILAASLAAPTMSLFVTSCSQANQRGAGDALTPGCGTDHGPTPALEEGPFFRAGAPDRHRLAGPGSNGERITVAGVVEDRTCRPVKNAIVQIWHADATGQYDDDGHRFRGVQRTDATGRWWFSTIVPALYPGRTRHFHMKVLAPGRAQLTTQLYFPDEPHNALDGLYDERLLLTMRQTVDGKFGHYNFIV